MVKVWLPAKVPTVTAATPAVARVLTPPAGYSEC